MISDREKLRWHPLRINSLEHIGIPKGYPFLRLTWAGQEPMIPWDLGNWHEASVSTTD